ncbi:LacI family transcriptional regulator [Hymenobacter lapidiphilus]|nr:LacI family transcriptional regulator [Hymenobacter sp. CCM 8763]
MSLALPVGKPGETRDAAHFAKLRELKLPTVFFDRECEQTYTASITTDDYDSGYRATRHLLERGCRRIVHFTLAQHLSIGQKRMQGYLDALRDADIAFDPALLVHGGSGPDHNTALM